MPLTILFSDTFYWISLLDPRDAYHKEVFSFSGALGTARVATAEATMSAGRTVFLAEISRHG